MTKVAAERFCQAAGDTASRRNCALEPLFESEVEKTVSVENLGGVV
jgi:hypothetical protein